MPITGEGFGAVALEADIKKAMMTRMRAIDTMIGFATTAELLMGGMTATMTSTGHTADIMGTVTVKIEVIVATIVAAVEMIVVMPGIITGTIVILRPEIGVDLTTAMTIKELKTKARQDQQRWTFRKHGELSREVNGKPGGNLGWRHKLPNR